MRLNKEHSQKIRKIGNSLQTTIPAVVAKYLNIEEGDEVVYKINSDGKVVIEKSEDILDKLEVDEEFLKLIEEAANKYDEALKELVDR